MVIHGTAVDSKYKILWMPSGSRGDLVLPMEYCKMSEPNV